MTHTTGSLSLALALILATNTGCDNGTEVTGGTTQKTTCPIWACGSNSAELNSIPIGELSLLPGQNTGLVNDWGARVVDFIGPAGESGFILDMSHGTLSATDGDITLSGQDLVGSRILIEDTVADELIDLHISDFREKKSWTTPSFKVDQFLFTSYDAQEDEHQPICSSATSAQDSDAWATIVSRERYSWTDKTVSASDADADGWNTIACAGNALYKMKMVGYEAQPHESNPFATSVEQRQATLKMLTADYCGTGVSFTENGTDLGWFNAAEWADNTHPSNGQFEAYWNHEGALCLDAPRLGAEQLEAIAAECASVGKVLTPCADFDGDYEWATEVP